MNTLCLNRRWYAVHVRSNQERAVADFLSNRGVIHFLPTYQVQSKRRDRRVTLSKPLFAGYLFVRVDYRDKERVEVLKAPGTVKIVSFADTPASIPEDVIESIKILVGAKEKTAKPHPLVQVGRRVRVVDGPFSGAIGRLQETQGRNPQLVVELEFLGRAVAVPINPEQVQPIFETE